MSNAIGSRKRCRKWMFCPAGDPLEMLRWLVTCRRFDTLAITKEDALRAKSYAAAGERSRLATSSANIEEYLASLGTQVAVGCDTTAQISRVAQLTQKTNQFNLTTRRYTETEIQERMQNPTWRVFWCSCRDNFADEWGSSAPCWSRFKAASGGSIRS